MTRFALALALVLAASTDARAQQLFAPSGAASPVIYQEDAWAITICGTRPVTWYSSDLPDVSRGMVVAHEAEHRRHMATFASCADFKRWKQADPENELRAEARAFCAGATHDHLTGRHATLAEAIWAHARVFASYSVWGLEDAASAVYRGCVDR